VAAHSPRGTLRALALVRRAAAEDRILTDYRTVAKKCEALRAKGLRIVFTNGVFDLFHVGHLRLLQTARALGDALVVGINSDESAARLKGRTRPVVPQFARAQLVAGVRGVDFCVVFEEDDPRELLRVVRPDLLVKGSEYSLRGVVGRRIVESYGGRVALIPHVSGWSTSSLLGKARRNG
jgi:D-beta-D-heptose 7-phosphate kinase/D-beta-D-heptose 1-phosphate adenosyltransferase